MTAIEWTDETWNPVTGCDRVSPGCDHCYALTLAKRLKGMGQAKYQRDGDPRTSGPGFGLTVHPDDLDRPLRWRGPRRVFVNSMSDLFHRDVPDDFIAETFAVMGLAPQHTFQVLTKRPQRMAAWVAGNPSNQSIVNAKVANRLGVRASDHEPFDSSEDVRQLGRAIGSAREDAGLSRHPTWPLPNVWLGTSIESDRYTWRADHLRCTPAAVRFLSLEPLLGPLTSLDLTGIDWVIVGGESGPGARPMHPDWVRDIRDRCVAAGVAFFFKQWGEHRPLIDYLRAGGGCPVPCVEIPTPDGSRRGEMARVGKKAAGRVLDGRTWDEMPGGRP